MPLSSRAVVPVLVGMMLLTGVCNTLLTKYQDMQCVAHCTDPPSHQRVFEQPVLQTLQMFVGEAGCWLVVLVSSLLARRRPAYAPLSTSDPDAADPDDAADPAPAAPIDATNAPSKPLAAPTLSAPRVPLRGRRILLLALPAACDIAGTTLMNVGLLFVAASIYQMTRGALVLFVGLFSVVFLRRRLGGWKWVALFVVVAGVGVVGLAGYIERRDAGKEEVTVWAREHTALETVGGVLLIAGAQVFTATQFVVEESIMEKYAMDPIRVVGWEGTFGFLITLLGMAVLHLAVGRTDAGRGGYFDAEEGFRQLFAHRAILVTSLLIMVSIGGFNFFGLSVTRNISATARSTIDTCRTLFIWLVSLGLGWESFRWLQLPGFALLVYGTALFNEIVRPPTARWVRRLASSERRE